MNWSYLWNIIYNIYRSLVVVYIIYPIRSFTIYQWPKSKTLWDMPFLVYERSEACAKVTSQDQGTGSPVLVKQFLLDISHICCWGFLHFFMVFKTFWHFTSFLVLRTHILGQSSTCMLHFSRAKRAARQAVFTMFLPADSRSFGPKNTWWWWQCPGRHWPQLGVPSGSGSSCGRYCAREAREVRHQDWSFGVGKVHGFWEDVFFSIFLKFSKRAELGTCFGCFGWSERELLRRKIPSNQGTREKARQNTASPSLVEPR